jgi:mono/diheme cytochrome c family protein
MARLANGNLLVACGDYHLQTPEEGRDLLAEVDQTGKVVWKLTRDQLVDQIEGVIDRKSGLEEMRVTNVSVADTAAPVPVAAVASGAVTGFLDQHCTACHDDAKAEGGLNLLDLAFAPEDAPNRARWVRLHDRVASGEMPPPEKRHDLSEEARAGFVALLGRSLSEADRAAILAEGRGPVRRLTRVEYEHRVRDLLALPVLDIRDKLPEDRDSHGFTRVSKQLDVSRVQLEGWLDAAEAALRAAVAPGIAPVPARKWRFTGMDLFPSLETFGEREAMFFARDGKLVPVDGAAYQAMTPEQRIDPTLEMALFRSATWPYYGYPRGFRAEHDGEYRVRFSGRAVRQVGDFRLVPAHQPQAMSFRARQPSGPDVSGDVRETGGWIDLMPEPREFETTIRLKKGETFEYSPLGLPVPFIRTDGGFFYDFPPMPPEGHPGIAIRWMEVEGPLAPAEWPPASHRALFGDLPLAPAAAGAFPAVEVVAADPDKEAKRLLQSFLERAACAPVSAGSAGLYHGLFRKRIAAGDSFSGAMLKAYEAILCSGHFLFLTEPQRDGSGDEAAAARLSHFLWSTAPDAGLRELARDGRLRDRGTLLREVDRLVADPRFDRFVADFTDQWLNLRQLRRDQADDRLYPEYRVDEYLVASMERETRAFFAAMVRDNLPAAALVSTDFAFVNDRLARHYDLPRVAGSGVRRVPLPGWSPYGGILTQASVLKVTANGTTTSPVTRGVWVLERILGGTPPPPPKSVPAIEPDIRGAATIREILARHTAVKSCAACHTHFDPLGFALENFDVMGAWRDRYRGMEKGEKVTGIDRAGHPFVYHVGPAVDAAGKLRSGESFKDVRELKAILTKQPRVLARNLLGHLVLYATGTPVRFSERVEIEAILDRTAPGGHRTGDLIRELAASGIFSGDPTLSGPRPNPVALARP